MALFDMTKIRDHALDPKGALVPVRRTTFADQGIQERQHLQAALRDRIELLDENFFVVAEEFGEFEGANRRIDLLCIDRDARLHVVELKRTSDGGHMELQALRYAAMVSTMTFEQVVHALSRYRTARSSEDSSEATSRNDLLTFLDADGGSDPDVGRNVGVVLASEDFSQEITTTVLWLNELHDFDIRCIRLSPYLLSDRLLLDVQQVVPLPEASAYTVRIRQKEVASRRAVSATGADRTKFVVVTPDEEMEPLPKRWAILRLVQALAGQGVSMEKIRDALPASKSVRVEGVFEDEDKLWEAMRAQHGKPDPKRWHLSDAIFSDQSTWVLHSNRGLGTRGYFDNLLRLAPPGFDVREASDQLGTPNIADVPV